VARLRGNLPLCHVRLSLFNWAPVRSTLDYNKSHTSIFFCHVGSTRVARLAFICHSGILPQRATSVCPVRFRFLCSSFSRDRREWIWRKDRFSSSKISDEGSRRVSREKSIISWCLFFLLSPSRDTLSRRIDDYRTRIVRVQARLITIDVAGPTVLERDLKYGLGDDIGWRNASLPSYPSISSLFSGYYVCVRLDTQRWRVPLFLESRAILPSLLSISAQLSSRSLRPCGLGRLRVCYLAATPLSNLQHRNARMQHTCLPCNRYALNSTRLEDRPPAVRRVSGIVSSFSRFHCSSPWTFRTGFKRVERHCWVL